MEELIKLKKILNANKKILQQMKFNLVILKKIEMDLYLGGNNYGGY